MQTFFILTTVLFLTTFRTIIGVSLSLFFIFLVVKTLPDLFISTPVVRIDQNGIQTSNKRNSRLGLILWTDITEIRITSFKFSHFLAIKVKNPEEYRGRVIVDKGALFARLFQDPFPYISLSFDLLAPSLNKAVEYIKTNHPDKLTSEVVKK